MERKDRKIIKEVTWEANYNAGPQTDREDHSTVELSGSFEEAELIVAALQSMRGSLIQARVMQIDTRPISLEKVEQLLADIEQPIYTEEPQIIRSELKQ